MFKSKRKRILGQPVGTDIDWFVIPIRTLQRWGIILVLLAAAAFLLYTIQSRRSPEERAKKEIETAAQLIHRAGAAGGTVRPGSHLAQAHDFLQGAEDSYTRKNYDAAFRLAVESQSYSRRSLGGTAKDEPGDASLITVEGDVSIQTAGRSAFGPALQRQSLFEGDFIKTGRTGSAEIMFSDGTLYTIRPGSLFEVRRPASPEAGGSQIKMGSGAVNGYTGASHSGVSRLGGGGKRGEDGYHDVPRQGDRVQWKGDGGPRGRGEDHARREGPPDLREGCRARDTGPRPADGQPHLRPEILRRDRLEMEPGDAGGALSGPDFPLAALRARRHGRGSRQPDRDGGTSPGQSRGIVLLARRGDRFFRPPLGLEHRAAIPDGSGAGVVRGPARFAAAIDGLRPAADGEPLSRFRQDGPGGRRDGQWRARRARHSRLVQEDRHHQPGGLRDARRQGRRRRGQ